MWLEIAGAVVVYFIYQWIKESLKVSNFGDKFVLVTGCDSGFGRELARRLDTLGFNVLAGCLTTEGSQSLTKTCSNRLQTVLLDVSKVESIEQAVKLVREKIPSEKGLWALVNNAGIGGPWGPSEMTTREDFASVFNVNLFGMVDITRLCLPMIRKAHGRVVNMASAAGLLAFVAAPYTCSKFGVQAYSDIIRREMAKYGVKVSILEPGVFKTSIINVDKMVEMVEKARDKSPQETKDFYGPGVINRYRDRFIGFNDGGSSDLSIVVDAYIHAVTARYPKKRYPLGKDCRLIFLPLSYLPDWFADWFVGLQIYKTGV